MHRLRIHPLRRLRVSLNLEILAQLLFTDGPALLEQRLDFLENERVALDSGRVVGFLVPDPLPDLLGFFRTGKPADLGKVVDGPIKPVEHRESAWAASAQDWYVLISTLIAYQTSPKFGRSGPEKVNVPNFRVHARRRSAF